MKKIFNNLYILTSIKKIILAIFNFINLILISRILGPSLKGEYSTVINYVSMLIVVFNFGLTIIYPHIKKNKDEYIPTLISMIYFFFSLLFFISMSLVFSTNNVFIKYIYVLVPFTLLANQVGGLAIIEDIRISTKIYIITVFIQTFCTIMLVFLPNETIIGPVVVYIIKDLSIILLSSKLLIKHINLEKISFYKFYKIMSMGFIPMLAALMSTLNYKLDILMLERLGINFYLIGLYTTGTALAQIVWMFPDAFKEVIAYKITREDNNKEVNIALRISVTIAILSILVMYIFGEYGISILFGTEYIDALDVTIIIFLGNISMVYFKIIGMYYQVKGKFKYHFWVLLTSVITNLILNYLLIPRFNIYGAAISSIASYSIAGLFYLSNYIKNCNVKKIDVIFIRKKDIKYMYNQIMKTITGDS
jgi:O-antigen/teichoic acid export membrane protein